MSLPVRLLNTHTYELFKGDHQDVRKDPRYAILSHRWCSDEIELQDLDPGVLQGANSSTAALNKIRGACKQAQASSIPWLWMDTCCIDKTNAVEETRSINAMFDWYRSAEVCFTYFHDISAREPGPGVFKRTRNGIVTDEESEWFERGWTLQELLAPENMLFYDCDWNFVGTRELLAGDIERVTGIATKYLQGPSNLDEASVATKFSWMAGRVTGQIEDIAYSMIGLLNVNLTPQYGEGRKAFMRLQRTLVETVPDESIFAWTVPKTGLQCFRRSGSLPSSAPQWKPAQDRWGLLAPSPDCFRDSRNIVVLGRKIVVRPGVGYRLTPEGIHFDLAYRQGRGVFGGRRSTIECPLNCWRLNNRGKAETVLLELVKTGDRYQRDGCSKRLESRSGARPDNNKVVGMDQMFLSPVVIYQPEAPR